MPARPQTNRGQVRSSPLTPEFRWNPTMGRAGEGRYIDARGHVVSGKAVRIALDKTLESSSRNMQALSQQLKDGQLTLDEWRAGMVREVKMSHMASTAAAKGGWAQVTDADNQRAGGFLRWQYDRLNKFAKQIESGEQKLDGRFMQRSQMYGQAARTTYDATQRHDMVSKGFDQERNILDPMAEHCEGDNSCVVETAKGWVPIGKLVRVGQRRCLTHCRCRIEYRKSATNQATG